MRKLFIALLSALLCLLLSVSALAADGLSTFQETQTYQPGMFSDVKAGSWYEAGVRAVYTRGIMNGTGGKAFAPSQTITWAQAAAIAARIHAACGGAEIAKATSELMKQYDVAVWAFHGTFASGESFDTTFGLMHCVEKAADIYMRVQAAGGAKQTMQTQNFIDIAALFGLTLPEKFLKD